MDERVRARLERIPCGKKVLSAQPTLFVNPALSSARDVLKTLDIASRDIEDASARLKRFAPMLAKRFMETQSYGGLIESPLTPIPRMKERLERKTGEKIPGALLLKRDSELPIAGSIKARGGIYEVLKHTEELALKNGLLAPGASYEALLEPRCRDFFSRHSLHVGSTGNLGLSVGILGAALGYRTVVHMSSEARQWKKELLIKNGAAVVEYRGDYCAAVDGGRRQAAGDPNGYFVDDEHSRELFMGYAAAFRLARQLEELRITVDGEHPLFVYLPCGVGGAPGGITFGLKTVFGDAAHCFFVEPVQAPCVLVGLSTGLFGQVSVQDAGLTGKTDADGLAVARPSDYVCERVHKLVDGVFTVADDVLFEHLGACFESEGFFLEPSACASFTGPERLVAEAAGYLAEHGLTGKLQNACHVAWATGGGLVPQEEREQYLRGKASRGGYPVIPLSF
ncbi:MAG: D-serine ammonia-lyase [Bacillota bacterium]